MYMYVCLYAQCVLCITHTHTQRYANTIVLKGTQNQRKNNDEKEKVGTEAKCGKMNNRR